MERTLLNELRNNIGQKVHVRGWVQEFRNLNKIKFLIIRDRSDDMQCIALKAKTDSDVFDSLDDISKESVVAIDGVVQESKQSRWGVELLIEKCKVISKAKVPLPIDNSDKSNTFIDKRIDYRFLDTRNKKVNTIFKIRSKIIRYVTDFFDENGFTIINTPKLTNIGVESGAELFTVDYFGKPAYLAQSPQVYKQMFVGGGFERVVEIAPVFRAEKSHTNRHLTEFMGVDMEMGFIDDENDVMDFIEGIFSNLIKKLNTHCKDELDLLEVSYKEFEKIPRIPMQEAKAILKKLGKDLAPEDDLDQEGEKILGNYAKEKLGSDFIFITNYPWEVRPFYHMKPKDNPKGTKSFDLLFRGVEICTGAQREHRYDVLVQQAKEKGIDFTTMGKYAELFEYGMPPHGGAGFGLDRITQRLLNLENVREAVLLPRDPERLEP